MGDDFDATLSRLFAQAPIAPDAAAFAAQVTARLDRGWAMRRAAIGVGGLAAGVVVAWQFLAGRFTGGLTALSDGAVGMVTQGFGDASLGLDRLMSLPSASETLWFGVALAALALAFGLTRAVESI